MAILTVTPLQRAFLESMANELEKALGYGVNDGTTKFSNEMGGYVTGAFNAYRTQTKELLMAAGAAMFSSGMIAAGGGGGGTVSSVGTGNGLTGGPITSSGTIDLLLNASGGLSKTLGGSSNELGIAAGGVSNAMLASSSLTITAGFGLTNGGSVSLGSSTSIAVDTAEVACTTNLLTMSNKTLTAPVIASGLTATGVGANNFGGSTGTFSTSTGAVSLAGNTTVLTGKTFSIADMTTGSIPFFGSSGLMIQDNSGLFYDNTNDRVGLGTATPGVIGGSTTVVGTKLHLKSSTEHTGLIIESTSAANKDPFILMFSPVVDGDFALFLDESDSQKLKFAFGQVTDDTLRNSNTKISIAQTGAITSSSTLTLSPMTQGSVFFAGTGGLVSQNNTHLFWDNSNTSLGIGTATPGAAKLWVKHNLTAASTMTVQNASVSGYSTAVFLNDTGTEKGAVGTANASAAATNVAGKMYIGSPVDIVMTTYDPTTIMTYFNSGKNVNIGTTTTDPGVKLNIEAASASAGIGLGNGSTLAVSAASTGRIRYNSSSQLFQVSHNAGSYVDNIAGTIVATRVPFASAAGILTDDSNLTWDNTSKFLNVGGSTSGALRMKVTSASSYNEIFFYENTLATVKGVIGWGNASVAEATRQNRFYLWAQTGVPIAFLGASSGEFGIVDTTNSRWGLMQMSPGCTVDIGATGGTTTAMAMRGGSTSSVSAASTGRIRYNESSQLFQMSENGGSYDGVVLLTKSQTLTTKTLTSPVINGATSSGSTSIDFSGNTGTFKTTTGALTFGGSSSAFSAAITNTMTGIGTAQTSGLILTNTTAATAGNQKYSPMLELTGQGWKTDTGGASQSTQLGLQVRPVQGSSAPTARLDFNWAINGGSFTTKQVLDSAGNYYTVATGGLLNAGSTNGVLVEVGSLAACVYGGDWGPYNNNSYNNGGSSNRWLTTYTTAIDMTGFINPNYGGTSTNVNTPTWTNVSYQNSYVDFGSVYGGSKYYKDPLGQVHLRIASKSGTASATMFTLPAGFRPGTQLLPQAQVDNVGGQTIIIATDGQVSCSPGGTTHALSGEIIFTAEG